MQHNLLNQLLRLAHNCLTYDFIGTSTDESSDDLTTVQMPTQWRPALLDPATLQLFFDLYDALPSTLSPMVSYYSYTSEIAPSFNVNCNYFHRLFRVWCKWQPCAGLSLIMRKEQSS